MDLIILKEILIVLSALSYLIGTIFLAKSIRFQSEIISKEDNSDFAKAVGGMGSPGRVDGFRFKTGIILNVIGFCILLVSTII